MSKSNVNLTSFRVRYPNLIDYDSETDVPLLIQMITDAEMDVAEAQFGDLRERAIVALVAHRTTKQQEAASSEDGTSSVFPISQATVGPVSMTFVVPPPDGVLSTNLHYYTTNFGVDFLEISRRMNSGVRVIRA